MGNLTIFLLSLLLFFLPLIFFQNGENRFEYPKFILFVSGVEIIFITFVMQKDSGQTRMTGRITILVFLFLLVTFISDMFGLDVRTSLLGSLWRRHGFVTTFTGVLLYLFVQLNRKQVKKHYHWFTTAIIFSGVAVSLFAIYQWIQVYFLKNLAIPLYNGRIVASMGNPNFLGGYLAMVLPFVMLDRRSRIKCGMTIKIISTAVIIFAIFLSNSRSALLATVVVFIIIINFIIFIKVIKKKKGIVLFGLIAIILIGIFFFKLNDSNHLTKFIKGFERKSTWDSREMIWKYGLDAVFKRPLLGYGQENFELVFSNYKKIKVDDAHNLFLEIAISSGLVGLILFLLILVLCLRTAKMEVKLSLITFLIIAQFNPLSIVHIALFWFLIGLSGITYK